MLAFALFSDEYILNGGGVAAGEKNSGTENISVIIIISDLLARTTFVLSRLA